MVLTAAAAVGLVATGAALRSGPSTAHGAPSAIPTDGSIADAAERADASVVTISVSREAPAMDEFSGFFMDPRGMSGMKEQAKGSGVIVTANGRILTNAHVVNGFDDITVTLPDGTDVPAKVIGKDTKADLAVIQIKGTVPQLKPITWGDSTSLRLGDIVLAIGDGLDVGKSVSMGIVSAKGRAIRDPRTHQGLEEYMDFIQTDATINPGNSGGALVNLKGELVGINTAIASRSGGSQGIGFAIPSNMARPIMDMLARDGKVTRGYLGVGIATVTPVLAKQLKLGSAVGVALGEIDPNGPAGKARLVEGDVVTAIDGAPMKSDEVLRNTIAMTKPGTTVSLEVVHRDGSKATVKAKLAEQPDLEAMARKRNKNQNLPFQVPDGWDCTRTQNGVECHSGN
jgi:serine protease Do